MKKIIKLMIFTMAIFMIGSNAEAAKKITTNRNNVSMKVGETTKIKVNVKNVKVKSSKIVKATVKGKVVSIKGVKAGKAKVKFTAKKMKSKTVKITVKKVKSLKSKKVKAKKNEKKDDKKETEESIKEKIDGYGDPYRNDIESYPYLDKTSFSKLDEYTKIIQNKLWQAMPDCLRDCLTYNKTTIIYTGNLDGGASGYAEYYNNGECISYNISIKNNDYNLSLIHEAAHIYDYFNESFKINVKDSVKNDFDKNSNKYGWYGSKNLKEFYAESISCPVIKNITFLNDNDLLKSIIKNVKIANRDEKIDISSSVPHIERINIDGIVYINGTTYKEYDQHLRDITKDYYDKIYDNLGNVFVSF